MQQLRIPVLLLQLGRQVRSLAVWAAVDAVLLAVLDAEPVGLLDVGSAQVGLVDASPLFAWLFHNSKKPQPYRPGLSEAFETRLRENISRPAHFLVSLNLNR